MDVLSMYGSWTTEREGKEMFGRPLILLLCTVVGILMSVSGAGADCWTTFISEDFDSYSPGDWPGGFYHFGQPAQQYPGTHVVSGVTPNSPTPENCFMNTNPYDWWGSDVTIPFSFDPGEYDLLIFEADLMFPSSSAGTHRNDVDIALVHASPLASVLKIFLTQPQAEVPVPPEDDLYIAATDAGVFTFLSAIGDFDQWTHIRGTLNLATATYDVYVNGIAVGTGLSIDAGASVEDIDALYLGKGFIHSGAGYFDNVAVRAVKKNECPPPAIPGKITFSYRPTDMSRFDLWSMNADGTGMVNLTQTPNESEYGPSVSPDGKNIAYVKLGHMDPVEDGIYVMSNTGTQQRQIVSRLDYPNETVLFPIWTDSRTVVFTAETEPCRSAVYRVDIEVGTPEFVYDTLDALGQGTGWPTGASTDASRFVVCAQAGCWAPTFDVYLIDAEGTNGAPLYEDMPDNRADGFARWSPTENKVAFTHWLTKGGNNRVEYTDVVTINTDGSDCQSLTDSTEVCFMQDWAPDGANILYLRLDDPYGMGSESRKGDLFVMDSDGSNVAQLTVLDGWFPMHHQDSGGPIPIACWYQSELTKINLMAPANGLPRSSTPTFGWAANGGSNNVYVVDIHIPAIVPIWTTPILPGPNWTMPEWIWGLLPSDWPILWRVRGADLGHSPLTIIRSDEIWWFYKH